MNWMDEELIKPEENVLVFCKSPDRTGLFKAYWSGEAWFDVHGQKVWVTRWKEGHESAE
ncbi:MAG: hypothetical protein R6U22_00700 [Desulfohalobiaceae bacterium]